jgi:hypothetical protein
MKRARRPIEEEEYIPTPEEEAELDAALAEADLGGGIPLEQFKRELQEFRERELRKRERNHR